MDSISSRPAGMSMDTYRSKSDISQTAASDPVGDQPIVYVFTETADGEVRYAPVYLTEEQSRTYDELQMVSACEGRCEECLSKGSPLDDWIQALTKYQLEHHSRLFKRVPSAFVAKFFPGRSTGNSSAGATVDTSQREGSSTKVKRET